MRFDKRLQFSLIAAALSVAAIGMASCREPEEDTSQVATEGPTASVTPSTTKPALTPTASASPATPSIPAGFETYTDPELGFSFARPADLVLSESAYNLPEKSGYIPAVEGRLLMFATPDGVPAIALAISPNPKDLTIEEWVNTYTGWSGEAREMTISGQRAVLDPMDQLNNPVPQIYFRHEGYFYTLQLNVAGIPESGYPAALTEQDMDRIIQGFTFRS